MPDGRKLRPEDIVYEEPDVPGTATDSAKAYAQAQRSKMLLYTWGSIIVCTMFQLI
eukprot:m.141734 g.141734  ORF g.141734 m.141734 type:complete len:56 (-) comp14860_c0_seq6:60-227(-)